MAGRVPTRVARVPRMLPVPPLAEVVAAAALPVHELAVPVVTLPSRQVDPALQAQLPLAVLPAQVPVMVVLVLVVAAV